MEKHLNAKVLLVDDEEDFIHTLSQRLEVRGLKVTGATRGADAVDLVDKQEFDAIVLDLAMPGMDGLETLKKIRENHPEAEIIILTGHASVKTSIEAMKLGAEDYLEKPVDMQDLLKKIEEAKHKRILVLRKQSKKEIEKILKSKAW
ncbi:response regulator [Desulfopila inferna]|uniref:response regulator n=1 Tax=Desulfopila inferna TaxID=468528 RepID=UPI001965D5F2|nr:response regulator [Desulfopila inferna]MBM9603048.1 response regulator [Desulfopila inferna]